MQSWATGGWLLQVYGAKGGNLQWVCTKAHIKTNHNILERDWSDRKTKTQGEQRTMKLPRPNGSHLAIHQACQGAGNGMPWVVVSKRGGWYPREDSYAQVNCELKVDWLEQTIQKFLVCLAIGLWVKTTEQTDLSIESRAEFLPDLGEKLGTPVGDHAQLDVMEHVICKKLCGF